MTSGSSIDIDEIFLRKATPFSALFRVRRRRQFVRPRLFYCAPLKNYFRRYRDLYCGTVVEAGPLKAAVTRSSSTPADGVRSRRAPSKNQLSMAVHYPRATDGKPDRKSVFLSVDISLAV